MPTAEVAATRGYDRRTNGRALGECAHQHQTVVGVYARFLNGEGRLPATLRQGWSATELANCVSVPHLLHRAAEKSPLGASQIQWCAQGFRAGSAAVMRAGFVMTHTLHLRHRRGSVTPVPPRMTRSGPCWRTSSAQGLY